MQHDALGNPITGQCDATLHAIDRFVHGFLAYESCAELILEAAAADADSCAANTYAGMLWMLLEAPHAAARAAAYLSRAERAAVHATRREQLSTALLKAWAGDDLAAALRICEQVSNEFPRDLIVVKIRQYFEFNRGNAPAMLRAALCVAKSNADVPYLHGMTAFAYEQCHLLDDAETAAKEALRMRRKEPWAQHALAHVLLTRGRIDEGAQFLESMADTWTGLNSFMLTHIWWHLALFYLSQGRASDVLRLYDEHCWGVAKSYSQDQVGAVSLLARFDLAGIEVGSRWRELAEHLTPRAHDTVQPFLTLQYLYGLARAGRTEADTLLDAVRRHAAQAPPFTRAAWQEVALPACEGLLAHARGDVERAWHALSEAMPRMMEVGGSHAQRDLFEQILLDAALKSGRLSTAQQLLETRRRFDPDGVPLNTALSSVYGRLRLPAQAAEAQARAARTQARHPPRR